MKRYFWHPYQLQASTSGCSVILSDPQEAKHLSLYLKYLRLSKGLFGATLEGKFFFSPQSIRFSGPVRSMPLGRPSLAAQSKLSVSFGHHPAAVHDQLKLQRSNDRGTSFFHWWDHKGTTQWVQYDFAQIEEISTVEIY